MRQLDVTVLLTFLRSFEKSFCITYSPSQRNRRWKKRSLLCANWHAAPKTHLHISIITSSSSSSSSRWSRRRTSKFLKIWLWCLKFFVVWRHDIMLAVVCMYTLCRWRRRRWWNFSLSCHPSLEEESLLWCGEKREKVSSDNVWGGNYFIWCRQAWKKKFSLSFSVGW